MAEPHDVELTVHLGTLVAGILAVTIGLVIYGYVNMRLWAWFVVPTLRYGTLTFGESVGLSLTVLAFTGGMYQSNAKGSVALIPSLIGRTVVVGALVLGLGWAIHRLAF